MIQYTLLVVGCDHGHHGHYGCIVDHAGCSKITIKVSGDPGADRRLTPGGRGGAPGGARLTTGPALPLEPESKYFC